MDLPAKSTSYGAVNSCRAATPQRKLESPAHKPVDSKKGSIHNYFSTSNVGPKVQSRQMVQSSKLTVQNDSRVSTATTDKQACKLKQVDKNKNKKSSHAIHTCRTLPAEFADESTHCTQSCPNMSLDSLDSFNLENLEELALNNSHTALPQKYKRKHHDKPNTSDENIKNRGKKATKLDNHLSVQHSDSQNIREHVTPCRSDTVIGETVPTNDGTEF